MLTVAVPKFVIIISLAYEALAAFPVQEAELPPALPVMLPVIVFTTVNPNKSTSLTFWRQQSANELRAQLKLRDLQRFKDEWAFKTKAQLFEIIRQLIKSKQW